jgi:hypothetical protein
MTVKNTILKQILMDWDIGIKKPMEELLPPVLKVRRYKKGI